MQKIPDKLEQLLEPVVTGLGYEWVGAELRAGQRPLLRLYIDGEEGVNLDDCAEVSHAVSGVLDVEDPIDGQYVLEVSSPGLDRPLFRLMDFERFAGHKVRVRLARPLAGQRNFAGVIEAVEGDEVVLVEGETHHRLHFADMDRANLVPEF
ncbi:MAG: ribosome maturation factor RimP [Halothiobacillaceae bacterium]|nr:ribosome maturation factor RimP [Halothiobacillaceae bacterium]